MSRNFPVHFEQEGLHVFCQIMISEFSFKMKIMAESGVGWLALIAPRLAWYKDSAALIYYRLMRRGGAATDHQPTDVMLPYKKLRPS